MSNQINRDIYVLSSKVKDPIDYVRLTNDIPIVFTFRDYDILPGSAAQVYVQKPAAISGNVVTVTVTDQMFAELGVSDLQIRITQGDEKLVSFSQPVRVHPNYTEGDADQSKNEGGFFDDADKALQDVENAVTQANQAVTNANNAAANANEAAQVVIDQKYILTTKQTFQMEATVNPTSYGNAIIEEVDGATYQEPNPSPESPKMIYAVGDMGFFDGNLLQGYYRGADGVYSNSAGSVCNKNPIFCKESDTIEFRYEEKKQLIILFYNENGEKISVVSKDDTNYILGVCPENTRYCNIDVIEGAQGTITPQTAGHITVTINGSYAVIFDTQNGTEFSRTYIPISSPLYEGDKILNVDGKYKVYRENAVLMLSGESSEEWGVWNMNANTVERYVYNFTNYADKNQLSESKSNMFIYQNSEADIEHFRFSTSGGYYSRLIIYIDKTLAENIDEFRTWLQSNVITIVYKLGTPIYEDIAQYPMYSLMAFDGETTIQLVSGNNLNLNNVITFPRNEDGALLTTTQAKGVYIMENIDIPGITSQLDALNNFMQQFDGKTIYTK